MSPIGLAVPHLAELRPIMHYAQSRDYRCPDFFAKSSSHLIMHYVQSRDYRCPESGLPLPGVGIIVARSRDYRCPHFFCKVLISAYYKDFRASYEIMQT